MKSNSTYSNTLFLVGKDGISSSTFVESEVALTGENQLLLRVERFAFTANNVTYAALGSSFQYFDFFPVGEEVPVDDPKSWGIIPVWGVASVVASTHPDIPAGQLVFGYLPTTRYVVLEVGEVTETGFTVRRANLPEDRKVYNQYHFTEKDSFCVEKTDTFLDYMMVFRPLFLTSFLLDDYVHQTSADCNTVIISSASSKTSFGLAYLLSLRKDLDGLSIVALTSSRNVSFVEGLGIYDSIVCYDELEKLGTENKTVYVDIAGNAEVKENLVSHFESSGNLAKVVVVGMSHWDKTSALTPPPPQQQQSSGPTTELFFAPGWIIRRQKEIGAELFVRMMKAWGSCMEIAPKWVTVHRQSGKDGFKEVYDSMLEGSASPSKAFVLSLWPADSKL